MHCIRKWINQPSTLQPWHEWHGRNVLAVTPYNGTTTTIYFIRGTTISARVQTIILADGWKGDY